MSAGRILQDGKPIKQISRELRVSRNTGFGGSSGRARRKFTYERRVSRSPGSDHGGDELDRMLAENARKPKRDRLTHIRIFEELRTLWLPGRATMPCGAMRLSGQGRSAKHRRRPMCP